MSFPFPQVWCVDFEFVSRTSSGERPDVVCVAARELRTGKFIRLWRDELGPVPPYPTGPNSLFLAYYVPAEIGCHLALGWPVPERIFDAYAEFRCLTNGRRPPAGMSLLSALTHYGIEGISMDEKKGMVDLINRGGPWSASERADIQDYNQGDVDRLALVFPHMLRDLARRHPNWWGWALMRGRYAAVVARMEHLGVPIDVPELRRIAGSWDAVKNTLIQEIDAQFGVYDGRSFREGRFREYLIRHRIPWPLLDSGRLDLKSKTFREMAKNSPQIAPLYELRQTLSQMKLGSSTASQAKARRKGKKDKHLAVGGDGRNRAMLSPFGSRTGRNQPSNVEFVIGHATWIRGLIRPRPGWSISYLDWSAQEVAIAAFLSGDPGLIAGVLSGDPYLAFAKSIGMVPEDATEDTHSEERERCKRCVLGVLYGMGAVSLAHRIECTLDEAAQLLRLHRQTYPVFWRWIDGVVSHMMDRNSIFTVFGWFLHTSLDPKTPTKVTSVQNYLMQANGAEMLRLACIYATEAGVRIVAPVHDAILIEAPTDQADRAAELAKAAMRRASRDVLGGFEIEVKEKRIDWPDRFMDEKRGRVMWDTVQRIVERVECLDPGRVAA